MEICTKCEKPHEFSSSAPVILCKFPFTMDFFNRSVCSLTVDTHHHATPRTNPCIRLVDLVVHLQYYGRKVGVRIFASFFPNSDRVWYMYLLVMPGWVECSICVITYGAQCTPCVLSAPWSEHLLLLLLHNGKETRCHHTTEPRTEFGISVLNLNKYLASLPRKIIKP